MIRIFALISWSFLATSALADEGEPLSLIEAWNADRTFVFDANEIDIDEVIWVARPIVVFADSPNDPRFIQQMEMLTERPEDLALRDVMLVTDTDPAAGGALRTRLRPRGFMMVIIGKNGDIALRKPAPWDLRQITRSIDKMPLRQQEIRDRRGIDAGIIAPTLEPAASPTE